MNWQAKKQAYSNNFCKTIVAIGASVGGPKALCQLFSKIPTGLNAAFLIVQHLSPGFSKSLAQRLDSLSSLIVKEAEHGEKIKADHAYLAPDNYHLEAGFLNNKLSLILKQTPSVNGHRPSVDVLMSSVARINRAKIGVIMTGMGSDGAQGMLELKKAGALNIGESAETCVVYGMSKASQELGALDYEVPLYEIADYIVQGLKKC